MSKEHLREFQMVNIKKFPRFAEKLKNEKERMEAGIKDNDSDWSKKIKSSESSKGDRAEGDNQENENDISSGNGLNSDISSPYESGQSSNENSDSGEESSEEEESSGSNPEEGEEEKE